MGAVLAIVILAMDPHTAEEAALGPARFAAYLLAAIGIPAALGFLIGSAIQNRRR